MALLDVADIKWSSNTLYEEKKLESLTQEKEFEGQGNFPIELLDFCI